ncbi:hypothetical protein ACQY0O_002309 [Thecaphora frezii]
MPTLEGHYAAWFDSASLSVHDEVLISDTLDADCNLTTRLEIAGVVGDIFVLNIDPDVFPNGVDVLIANNDEPDFTTSFRTRHTDPDSRRPWSFTTKMWKFGRCHRAIVYIVAKGGGAEKVSVVSWTLLVDFLALDIEIWKEIARDPASTAIDLTTKEDLPPDFGGYGNKPRPFCGLARPVQSFQKSWKMSITELDDVCERLRMLDFEPVNAPEPPPAPVSSQEVRIEEPQTVPRRARDKPRRRAARKVNSNDDMSEEDIGQLRAELTIQIPIEQQGRRRSPRLQASSFEERLKAVQASLVSLKLDPPPPPPPLPRDANPFWCGRLFLWARYGMLLKHVKHKDLQKKDRNEKTAGHAEASEGGGKSKEKARSEESEESEGGEEGESEGEGKGGGDTNEMCNMKVGDEETRIEVPEILVNPERNNPPHATEATIRELSRVALKILLKKASEKREALGARKEAQGLSM